MQKTCAQPKWGTQFYRPKYLAFRSVYSFHLSGRSSSAKIADTGQTGTQAPQSMHSTGSMYNISSSAYAGESFFGWIQSTGHASTHAVSLVPIHGSAITYAIKSGPPEMCAEVNGTDILTRMATTVQRSAAKNGHRRPMPTRPCRTQFEGKPSRFEVSPCLASYPRRVHLGVAPLRLVFRRPPFFSPRLLSSK